MAVVAEVPEETAVLVVGGGPVGLALAFELGRRGVECLVVEPRRAVSWERPRAKTTSARTMEHLRRWGIAEAVRAAAPLALDYSDQVVFCTALQGREITRFSGCFALTTGEEELYAEAGQQIPQPRFEETLRRELAEVASATLLLGWRLVGLSEAEDGVGAEIEEVEGGARRVLRARFAVGCDGARSLVREATGAHYVGTTDLRPNLNLVFRAAGLHEGHALGRAIHYWVLNPRVAGVLGPLDGGDLWWVIATGEGVLDDDPRELINELVGSEVDAEIVSTDPWAARLALASSYGSRRAFLAGDAAHLNPPWGGHGFNTGVGDAVNLGWKLAAVLQGWGGAELLASYEAERRPVAAETIALAEANMRVLAVDLADPRLELEGHVGDAARTAAARQIEAAKAIEFHSLGLVLGYSYAGSPIVATEGSRRRAPDPGHYRPSGEPGGRLPHRWLAPGCSLYDRLGSGFTLVLVDSAASAGPWSEAAARRGLPLAVLHVEGDSAAELGAEALLVRPDQHIAWRGAVREPEPGALLDLARGAPGGVISRSEPA
ncbi:MAG TPA: FAD-dependent monooxygenase [Acidimicrobiales bacterium]|nr:FAD-dependent monooxygenase [Acidimicrobiales bacterium]